MFKKRSFRPRRPSRAGVVVLAPPMGHTAYATNSPTGVITECYQGVAGDLSVIDAQAGQQCNLLENRLDWNQSGSQGPTSHADPTGALGLPRPARPEDDASLAETKLFARLGADGLLQVASSSVVKDQASKHTNNQTGAYQVGFNQPVDSCVPVATVHLPGGSNLSPAFAEVGYTSQTQVRRGRL